MKKWLLITFTIVFFGLSGCGEKEKPEIDSVMMMEEEGNESSTIIFEILSICAIFAVLANFNNRKR
jgi:protein involved in sex pheromone biosynthesis